MNFKIIFITLFFLLLGYIILHYSSKDIIESFSIDSKKECPNLLIQKGKQLYLFNSKKTIVPGVNPITFENLEDYVEFIEWQRANGMNCPVLYLQHTEEADGKQSYRIRPSPTGIQGGLNPDIPYRPPPRKWITKLMDAGRDDPPYNINSYPAYDPLNQTQGEYTPLDELDYITQVTGMSPNPMDSNWGGAEFTQALVDAGYYKENEVAIRIDS